MIIEQVIGLMIFAFLCELIDSSLGMGYGTTLTPILLIIGFEPILIVPTILLSEFITGLTAGILHHKTGNVSFTKNKKHKNTVIILSICSIIGTLLGVNLVLNIPSLYIKLYIGILVLSMGVLILLTRNKEFKFSYKKVTLLGIVASFNKGISGGGYGPVVTSGQVISGVEAKSSVGITSLAESMTCLVGCVMFFVVGTTLEPSFALPLIIGALLSVPFSVFIVKRINNIILKRSIALVTIILGLLTLWNLFM